MGWAKSLRRFYTKGWLSIFSSSRIKLVGINLIINRAVRALLFTGEKKKALRTNWEGLTVWFWLSWSNLFSPHLVRRLHEVGLWCALLACEQLDAIFVLKHAWWKLWTLNQTKLSIYACIGSHWLCI